MLLLLRGTNTLLWERFPSGCLSETFPSPGRGASAGGARLPAAGTHLYSRRDDVDDLDGAAVRVSRQRLAHAVDLHLAFGLCARLLAVDCLAGGTLQTAVLQGQIDGNR